MNKAGVWKTELFFISCLFLLLQVVHKPMERPRISDAIEYMNEVREFAQFFPCVDSGTLRKRRGEVQGFPVCFNHDEGKGVGISRSFWISRTTDEASWKHISYIFDGHKDLLLKFQKFLPSDNGFEVPKSQVLVPQIQQYPASALNPLV